MEILISEIPEDGLHIEGDFPDSIFDLDPDDSIQPAGRVRYRTEIYHHDGVVMFSGLLAGPFRLQCGTCLEFFDYEAEFEDWTSELDLEPGQRSFDFREVVREDFLLALPSHPRCDEFAEDRVCPRADYLTDDPGVDGEDFASPEADEEDGENEGGSDVWNALDQLGDRTA